MKKVLLIALALIVIIAGVFYKQILATIDFYQYQSDNASTFKQAELTWKDIPFTSITNRGLAEDSLAFGSLYFPIPFPANKSTGADSAFALGTNQSVSIAYSREAQDFLDTNGYTGEKRRDLCQFLTDTSSRGACVSNYSLYRAVLELNETDIHVFAKVSTKKHYNEIMTIRADMLPSQQVSGFETSRVKGFLFKKDANNHVAKLFDQQDQEYTLTFTNLPQSDVAFILSNVTVARN